MAETRSSLTQYMDLKGMGPYSYGSNNMHGEGPKIYPHVMVLHIQLKFITFIFPLYKHFIHISHLISPRFNTVYLLSAVLSVFLFSFLGVCLHIYLQWYMYNFQFFGCGYSCCCYKCYVKKEEFVYILYYWWKQNINDV